ncbi:hypothetical protein [Limnoraphis robusta]|uniref:Uncharacterized protein n=1 Tax=Limnoraphis robusta CS-951 TaxID=1637645 RepID=A0A0F5YMN0_9CYAN|nr:hypothetical protein [Limnoraphis robusta]KKD40028.1 hypothetical protein WN50_00145 [Limnoraphis robusta CS-951]
MFYSAPIEGFLKPGTLTGSVLGQSEEQALNLSDPTVRMVAAIPTSQVICLTLTVSIPHFGKKLITSDAILTEISASSPQPPAPPRAVSLVDKHLLRTSPPTPLLRGEGNGVPNGTII